MFTLTYFDLLLAASVFGVAYFGAKYLFQKDTELENRRAKAQELALMLKEEGFEHLPTILNAYSRGDYSGIGHEIHLLHLMLKKDPKFLQAELDKVFEKYKVAKEVRDAKSK